MMVNTLRLSFNEKKFIDEVLHLEQKFDGRRQRFIIFSGLFAGNFVLFFSLAARVFSG